MICRCYHILKRIKKFLQNPVMCGIIKTGFHLDFRIMWKRIFVGTGDRMIRIILCDEDAQDRVVMEKYCQCFFAEMRTAYELSIYSAEEVLVQDKEADVLILDAELKQITAIRIMDMLQKH